MEEKKIKIEIKKRITGKILFEYEKVDNTVKDTVIKAIEIGADLRDADLRDADLGDANLRGAYLGGAYLRGADLGDAKNIPFIPSICPSDGEFIGWKKVYDHELDGYFLVKLLILEDSKRSSATGRKCRCDKAKVLGIYKIKDLTTEVDEVINTNYVKTVYKVGEMVEADSFDENRFKECSNGIHFFIEKQEAIDY